MTVTDQLKIIDNKIEVNQAQYDVNRLAAKISTLSSDELEKYEYLTGEDLGYKQSVVEQAKFEYSPLGKFFNKGLEEKDKKEGLLKRQKNTEGKNEEQLKAIEDQRKVFKNLIADKISIDTANEYQKTFVFNLIKGYNVSNFLKEVKLGI